LKTIQEFVPIFIYFYISFIFLLFYFLFSLKSFLNYRILPFSRDFLCFGKVKFMMEKVSKKKKNSNKQEQD